jgi:hypothetical protein
MVAAAATAISVAARANKVGEAVFIRPILAEIAG